MRGGCGYGNDIMVCDVELRGFLQPRKDERENAIATAAYIRAVFDWGGCAGWVENYLGTPTLNSKLSQRREVWFNRRPF